MEAERVYQRFDRNFSKYKNLPIALYGLGINTKYLLEKAKDYKIIGIVANDRIGEFVYGKKVMSLDEIENRAKIIVIVSQMKSVKIIYKRIKYIESKGIDIYDIWGDKISDDLCNQNQELLNSYGHLKLDNLKNEIDRHDTIIFGIFDILIMSKVLKLEVIFDIIELQLKEKGYNIDFKKERIKAELECQKNINTVKIEDVYTKLRINTGIDKQILDWLISEEFKLVKRYSIKRQAISDIFEYATSKGKKVILIANSLYSSEQIHEILMNCFDSKINQLMICNNSDVNTFFEEFRSHNLEEKILYIGTEKDTIDDFVSKFRINTYFILSAYDMFSRSTIGHIIEYATSTYDFIMIGLLVSKAFNNPFILSESKGKLKINNMYDLGYYCFAPITVKFLIWVYEKLRGENNSVILFSSRDGFLIFNLYMRLKKLNPELNLPDGIYFYISRRASTVVNIATEDDIVSIVTDILKLSVGNLLEILEQRLGVKFDEEDIVLNRQLIDVLREKSKEEIISRVLEYKDKILENSYVERMHFLKYINKNNIDCYNKVYLFDLYTKGTTFYNLTKLINRNIDLICYAVKDFPNEYISTMNNVNSMFGNIELLSNKWFEKCYQLFEIIYSSPEGQLKCFDDNGEPQFIKNSSYNYVYIEDAQRGILDFICDLEKIDDRYYKKECINLNLVDSMCKMMIQKQSDTFKDIKNGFTYYDSFASESSINLWDRII